MNRVNKGGRPQIGIPNGTRFGRLVVVGQAPAAGRRSRSVCKCDCGNQKIVTNHNLKTGNVSSCGCLLADRHLRHGDSRRRGKTRLYNIWCGINARCSNPGATVWKHYGGRGIRVCTEWTDYAAFKAWAEANGYMDDLTIDRIDNDGNYEPSNCRWISHREQCMNKRSTIRITINGRTKTVPEWCAEFGISEKLARSRMSEGKTGPEIFKPRMLGK